MEGNCLLVCLAIFYLAAFFTGFFLFIPLLMAQQEFRSILYGDEESNSCMLFALVGRYDYFQLRGTEMNFCRISLYFPVAAMIIGLILGILHSARAWKAVAEMDDETKYKMWAWPWLILDFVVLVLMTLCASYTSAGLAETCDGIRRHMMGELHWYEQYQSSCFTYIAGHASMRINLTLAVYVAVVTYWLLVAIWLALTIMQAVRVRRNSRERRRLDNEFYFPPPLVPETAL